MLFKDIADDVLAQVLEYLQDATPILNVAITTSKMMVRVQKLVVVAHYEKEERRVLDFPNARQMTVYHAAQLMPKVQELTIKETEQSVISYGRVMSDKQPGVAENGRLVVAFKTHPNFEWCLPDTLTRLHTDVACDIRTLPPLLVELLAPKCKLTASFPETLETLTILETSHDEIRASSLQCLDLRHTVINYSSLPQTLTSCTAALENAIIVDDKYDISRFKVLVHIMSIGLASGTPRGYPGQFELRPDFLCVEAELLRFIIRRVGPRPVIKVLDFFPNCVPPGLDTVKWNFDVLDYYLPDQLPKGVTQLNCWRYAGQELPYTLTKLVALCSCEASEVTSALERTEVVSLDITGENMSFADISRLRTLKNLRIIGAGEISLSVLSQLSKFYAKFYDLNNAEDCALQVLELRGVVVLEKDGKDVVVRDIAEIHWSAPATQWVVKFNAPRVLKGCNPSS